VESIIKYLRGEKVKYAALIGDIKASRNIEHREEAQIQFESVIKRANNQFSQSLAARFSIYAGDECEALFFDPVEARKASYFIRREMDPIKLSFGIGIGFIQTPVNRLHVGRIDGPAFHMARAALDRSKKENNGFVVAGEHPDIELANALISLITIIERKTKKRSSEAAGLMDQYSNQYVVAEKMGVAQATVNRFLARAHYYKIRDVMTVLDAFLIRLIQ
jgi:hypothetical protein